MSKTADGLTVERKWTFSAGGCSLWRGYDAGHPVHAAGEAAFVAEHTADLDEDPDRCGCGGLMCGCGAHYPAEFLTELPHAVKP